MSVVINVTNLIFDALIILFLILIFGVIINVVLYIILKFLDDVVHIVHVVIIVALHIMFDGVLDVFV